jgi:hypothetical protein
MKDEKRKGRPAHKGGNGEPAGPHEVPGDHRLIAAVQRRIEARLGPIRSVWCTPQIEDRVHVDLHWVPPAPRRPWHTILTTGMSERPMRPPEEAGECRFGEIYLCLPPEWPLEVLGTSDPRVNWPLRMLSDVADYPHREGKWLWYGHTLAFEGPGSPPPPGTGFRAAALGPPLSLPPRFNGIKAGPGRTVWYMSLLPIYPEERELAVRNGTEELFERLRLAGVTDVVDVRRRNVARPSRPGRAPGSPPPRT